MAVKNIAVTDTLETFRALNLTIWRQDFGDIGKSFRFNRCNKFS